MWFRQWKDGVKAVRYKGVRDLNRQIAVCRLPVGVAGQFRQQVLQGDSAMADGVFYIFR